MVHRFEGLCFVVALKVLLSLDPTLILPLKSTNTHLCLLKHRCVFVLLPGVARVGRLHLNLRTLMKVLMCKREDPTSLLSGDPTSGSGQLVSLRLLAGVVPGFIAEPPACLSLSNNCARVNMHG